MAQPKLSKNMQWIVARRKQTDEFLLSDEHRQSMLRHIQWLRDHDYPQEIIDKYEAKLDDPLAYKTKTRKRRGKVVVIPEAFQGVVTHRQTIRKRPSKMTTKARRRLKRRNDRKET